METSYNSKHLGHLGLVSGMIDELGLVQSINELLWDETCHRQVSPGVLCKALILNGLGFSQRTLYMVSSFFSDKPIELLLGEGIAASELNDTVLGRFLDTLHSYGCTKLYGQLSLQICCRLGLHVRTVHQDITSFHVDGRYDSPSIDENEHVVKLTPGYSRDHRPDLNQVMLNLIVENQTGIALHMQALDGNASDKEVFGRTINEYVKQMQFADAPPVVVMDSSGYTKQTLMDCGQSIKWISRVPEVIASCKELLTGDYPHWQALEEGYSCVELCSTYASIKQRWLLVFSQASFEREVRTLKKHYQKKSSEEMAAFKKLTRASFDCQADAQKAASAFVNSCKYLTISDLQIVSQLNYPTKGRPTKDTKQAVTTYTIAGNPACQLEDFRQKKATKGRFILATNELDETILPAQQLLKDYKSQAKVERGFRFLKDPQFIASSFFVKKPQRVEALLFIMALSLSIYAAIEYQIRNNLKQSNETLPNQLGKQVQNPTARWLFSLFNNVQVLYVNEHKIVLNLKEVNLKIIQLLGQQYKKYYLII